LNKVYKRCCRKKQFLGQGLHCGLSWGLQVTPYCSEAAYLSFTHSRRSSVDSAVAMARSNSSRAITHLPWRYGEVGNFCNRFVGERKELFSPPSKFKRCVASLTSTASKRGRRVEPFLWVPNLQLAWCSRSTAPRPCR